MIARHGALVTAYRPVMGKTGASAVPTGYTTITSGFRLMFGSATAERQQEVFGLVVDDAVTGAYPFAVDGLLPEDRLVATSGPFAGRRYRIVATKTHTGPPSVEHREALLVGSTEAFP